MAKKKRSPRQRPRKPNMAVDAEAKQLIDAGKVMEGLRLLDNAIDRGEDTPTTWRLMGTGLLQVKEYAQAVGALDRALSLRSDDAESRYALAETLFQLGDVPQAAKHFEHVARQHDHLNAWCNLATIIPGDPTADNERIGEIRRTYADRISSSRSDRCDDPVEPYQDCTKLRLGYISAYFANENYMKPVWQLIRSHDRDQFQIHLFADDVAEDNFDWFNESRTASDKIHLTTDLANRQLVDLIREQQLDVLVDLNAYSVPWRLPIFTHRLARVVAAWFNMYATSGLPGIDWIIGDSIVVAESEQTHYSERVARLPQSYLSFDVDYQTPDIVPAPCLTNGYLTFGSLISQYKVTPQVYDAWARILRGCNDARLMLGNRVLSSECNRQYILQQFSDRGVDPDRITCLPPADHLDFLRYYERFDIALDAFPYNGGTTTTEAMWQGVPTLAINGDRWAARTSATLLLHSHLGDFVAKSIDEYVGLAIGWASDSKRFDQLNQIRSTMRSDLRKSTLCNGQSMVRSFERLLMELAS